MAEILPIRCKTLSNQSINTRRRLKSNARSFHENKGLDCDGNYENVLSLKLGLKEIMTNYNLLYCT